jgi:hypothetical protein
MVPSADTLIAIAPQVKVWTAKVLPQRPQKKADVVKRPQAFDHVGLLAN